MHHHHSHLRGSAIAIALAAIACGAPTRPAPPVATPGVVGSADIVTRFDAAAHELPEGLWVADHEAFVGFAPSGRIARVSLATGAASPFAQIPAPIPGKGFMTGLAQRPTGELYAGLASFVPDVRAGIYRVGPTGGTGSLWAEDPALAFPNGLAFDTDGALFVTDSAAGVIFRVDDAGHVTRWTASELLAGRKHNCGPDVGPDFDIGANGIVVERDAVYVVNTDKATLIEIARGPDGRAGAATILAGPDCEQLGGADGLARAADGTFLVAVNRQDKVMSVSASGRIGAIVNGAPLDFPASISTHGADAYVTNFALYTASGGKPSTPGLLRIPHVTRSTP